MRLALALLLALLATRAEAQTNRAQVVYTVTGVAANAAIDSGNKNTVGMTELVIVLVNGNTTQSRTLTLTFKDNAATPATLFTIAASACAASTTCIYALGRGVTATGITAAWSIPPSPNIAISTNAPASGSGTSSMYVYSR